MTSRSSAADVRAAHVVLAAGYAAGSRESVRGSVELDAPRRDLIPLARHDAVVGTGDQHVTDGKRSAAERRTVAPSVEHEALLRPRPAIVRKGVIGDDRRDGVAEHHAAVAEAAVGTVVPAESPGHARVQNEDAVSRRYTPSPVHSAVPSRVIAATPS